MSFFEPRFFLQKIMNFTFTLTQPPDGQWGSKRTDDTWTGMVGLLADQTIDIGELRQVQKQNIEVNQIPVFLFQAATDFTVTKERSVVITFAEPITQIYHSLFIKNPSGTYNYMAYIEPLHYLSWIVILLFSSAVPLVMFATFR